MDLNAQWGAIKHRLQDEMDTRDVMIWFKDTELIHLAGGKAVVQVANAYYADWIRDNYLGALSRAIQQVAGGSAEVMFSFADDPTADLMMKREPTMDDHLVDDEPEPDHARVAPVAPKAAARSVARRALGAGLNASMTFSSFVVGPCNQFAHAAAEAVADSPASHYNPLFIYGSTGLGKTHLMHAIGHHIQARDPKARVVYVTAENFMNEMINSIRFKRTEDFRTKYRENATVLLVDDIQFLSGRERTQEEFFHTFNALQNSGRQIVLTSDVEPSHIKALEPRLRTRFEGGLIADTQPPDRETLLAILGQKCEQAGFYAPPDLAEAIANTVHGNVRELEGIINRISALKRLYHEPLTLEFARRHMPKLFSGPKVKVTVPAIIEAVARFHNIRAADITGKKRTRTLTRPRHMAMYLARHHTQLSFPELGREFGGRDHSTIQHGCRKIQAQLDADPDTRYALQLIEQSLSLPQR